MSENYNPNQDNQNGTNEQNQTNTPNGGNMWNVPRQPEDQGFNPPYHAEEQGFRPPQYAGEPQAPNPPPQQPQQPQQQYSTVGGWQKPPAQPPAQQGGSYQWNFAEYEQAQALHPKRKRKGLVVFSIILASVVVVSLVSFAGVGVVSMMNGRSGTSDTLLQDAPKATMPGIEMQNKPATTEAVLPGGKLSTEQIVEKLEPSIVAITTYIGGQSYQAQGMGSGIVIRADGYIVTNAHVVKDARGITVTMSDGTTKYEGRVVGADTQTDLAVIKIDAEGLTPAIFGNSGETKVGEKVLAIGNPQSLDFSGSVTQGIVSGLNRSLLAGSNDGSAPTEYASLIQTDAAINPGNSGGALVNEYGQVIGINSAKLIATGAEGMGFAIPSSEAAPIVEDLINHGRVTGRVMLGITVLPIDQVAARMSNLPMGLQVQTTQKDSDISKKGVVPGDIITKVSGKDIESQSVLTTEMKGKKPGDTIDLEVYRPGSTASQKGRFFNITVQLIEATDTTTATNNTAEQVPYDPYYGQQNPETQPPANDQAPSNQDLEEFFNQFFG